MNHYFNAISNTLQEFMLAGCFSGKNSCDNYCIDFIYPVLEKEDRKAQ